MFEKEVGEVVGEGGDDPGPDIEEQVFPMGFVKEKNFQATIGLREVAALI